MKGAALQGRRGRDLASTRRVAQHQRPLSMVRLLAQRREHACRQARRPPGSSRFVTGNERRAPLARSTTSSVEAPPTASSRALGATATPPWPRLAQHGARHFPAARHVVDVHEPFLDDDHAGGREREDGPRRRSERAQRLGAPLAVPAHERPVLAGRDERVRARQEVEAGHGAAVPRRRRGAPARCAGRRAAACRRRRPRRASDRPARRPAPGRCPTCPGSTQAARSRRHVPDHGLAVVRDRRPPVVPSGEKRKAETVARLQLGVRRAPSRGRRWRGRSAGRRP